MKTHKRQKTGQTCNFIEGHFVFFTNRNSTAKWRERGMWCVLSSQVGLRKIPRFLPFYYSYSRPLREVRCFPLKSIVLETVVAAYCRNSRTEEI